MTDPQSQRPRIIRIFGRSFAMPRSRAVRIAIGALLILFGIVGFLPVVGFWMIPLGVFVISHEFAMARRYRRRSVVWWGRWRRPRRRDAPPKDAGDAA
jgi:purine-cytosine permease-like protein